MMHPFRGDLTALTSNRHPSSKIQVILGSDEYSLKLSTVQRHLPGLYRIFQRDLRHRTSNSKRQIDLLPILSSIVDLRRHAIDSNLIACARMILDQVQEYETTALATALFRSLDSHILYRGSHKGPSYGLQNLILRYAGIGRLLDQSVLGCGKELFDTFSGFFIDNSHIIVRDLSLSAVLDFIHALERTAQPMKWTLVSMLEQLDSRKLNELLYLERQPTQLGSYLLARTRNQLRKIIRSATTDSRIRKGDHSPGLPPGSHEMIVRPCAHPGGGRLELIPRMSGSALVPGDEYSRAALHNIVKDHPERIYVQESHGRHRHRPHRRHHRHKYPGSPSSYISSGDDDYPYNDSEFDYDICSPCLYGYDDDGFGEMAVSRYMPPYDDSEDSEGDLYSLYDDIAHGARRIPYVT
ncbi:MAG: hypothetical protein M1830_010235 [Pleopsidium flavum]|nr:MAG: hypothetical protein M1830_010235 [Pleopsidium flavum]